MKCSHFWEHFDEMFTSFTKSFYFENILMKCWEHFHWNVSKWKTISKMFTFWEHFQKITTTITDFYQQSWYPRQFCEEIAENTNNVLRVSTHGKLVTLPMLKHLRITNCRISLGCPPAIVFTLILYWPIIFFPETVSTSFRILSFELRQSLLIIKSKSWFTLENEKHQKKSCE